MACFETKCKSANMLISGVQMLLGIYFCEASMRYSGEVVDIKGKVFYDVIYLIRPEIKRGKVASAIGLT